MNIKLHFPVMDWTMDTKNGYDDWELYKVYK